MTTTVRRLSPHWLVLSFMHTINSDRPVQDFSPPSLCLLVQDRQFSAMQNGGLQQIQDKLELTEHRGIERN